MTILYPTSQSYGPSPQIPLNPDLTSGSFESERDAEVELDQRLQRLGAWRVYREVEGRPFGQLPTDDVKGYRIDRVLMPTQAIRDAGWPLGPVGIECKRSNEKIGKPVAQILDYRRALWHHDVVREQWFALGWVFLWPAEPQHGPIASVMAQNRVGTISPSANGLSFMIANHCVAFVAFNGDHRFKDNADSFGRKVGSR